VRYFVLKTIRGVVAVILIVAGIYLLIPSAQSWLEGGLQILANGEKGKDAFSGVFFSAVFIGYGVWELFNLARKT
jgi:hypothetical protein